MQEHARRAFEPEVSGWRMRKGAWQCTCTAIVFRSTQHVPMMSEMLSASCRTRTQHARLRSSAPAKISMCLAAHAAHRQLRRARHCCKLFAAKLDAVQAQCAAARKQCKCSKPSFMCRRQRACHQDAGNTDCQMFSCTTWEVSTLYKIFSRMTAGAFSRRCCGADGQQSHRAE